VPLYAFLALAVFVEVAFIGGEGEIHHRQAARRVTDFRVLPEISNDHRSVKRHELPSFSVIS
jgi:hypothetical protein